MAQSTRRIDYIAEAEKIEAAKATWLAARAAVEKAVWPNHADAERVADEAYDEWQALESWNG